MAYADEAFYSGTYSGDIIPSDEISKYLARASVTIDRETGYKIGTLADWPTFSQTQIKMAVCAQADYDYQYGDLAQAVSGLGGYSIGDVSVSSSQKTGAALVSGLPGTVRTFLYPTGLLYVGV